MESVSLELPASNTTPMNIEPKNDLCSKQHIEQHSYLQHASSSSHSPTPPSWCKDHHFVTGLQTTTQCCMKWKSDLVKIGSTVENQIEVLKKKKKNRMLHISCLHTAMGGLTKWKWTYSELHFSASPRQNSGQQNGRSDRNQFQAWLSKFSVLICLAA